MRYNALISMMTKASAFDPDAQLFFNAESAAGVTLSTTQKNAVNQWVIDAKAANIWTKMKAVYPIVGGTATAHKFNLKNPADTNAAFRLSFVGGGTHSSNGYQPNGVNAYANTFCGTSNMLLNSAHISYYSRTNTTSNTGTEFTSYNSAVPSNSELAIKVGTSGGQARINQSGALGYITVADSRGLFLSNRTASNVTKFIRNGGSLNTYTNASTGVSTLPFFLGAGNSGGTPFSYSILQCAFASIGDGLTDLESQLFYQITEKYQVALSRNVNTTQSFYYNSAYNNETNAFLFSTQITDNTIQTATNTLVNTLKTAGIFTKMKAIYPMVGGTATTCKFNLVNAQDTNEAFRLVFSGGGTFSSNGYLPNGTNAYANTNLNPLVQNNTHLSYYSRTNAVGTGGADVGNFLSAPTGAATYIDIRGASNLFSFRVNAIGTESSFSNTSSLGLAIINRVSSTQQSAFFNNVKNTFTVSSTGVPTGNITIGAVQFGGSLLYGNHQCAFASIGDGLTDAEATSLYNAVNAFQVTLGRNV